MKSKEESGDHQDSEKVSAEEAMKLKEIIQSNNSIWIIAVKSFELGQKH